MSSRVTHQEKSLSYRRQVTLRRQTRPKVRGVPNYCSFDTPHGPLGKIAQIVGHAAPTMCLHPGRHVRRQIGCGMATYSKRSLSWTNFGRVGAR